MKLLGKLCGFLLVTILTVTVSAYVLDSTLLNAHYLESKASSEHLYDTLATSLPAALAGSGPESAMVQQNLTGIITSAYIQSKIEPFLTGLQAYYKADGPAPTLDLTDLAVEAQRQGLELPAAVGVDKPIVFQSPASVKQGVGWISLAKVLGPILALVLTGLIIVIYHGWHRYSALAKIFATAAFSEALVFLVFKLTPGLLESLAKSNDVGPIAPPLIEFFKGILGDVGNDFGKAAIGLAAAAGLMLVIGLVVKSISLAGRFGHHEETLTGIRPTPDNRPPVG